jgi:hypothetical protein
MTARLTLVILCLAFAGAATAETFRCGQWIASPDMTVEELLEKCGQPTTKSVEVVDVYARSGAGGRIKTGTSTIETWTYDRGSQSFPMVVTIVDGEIRSMERGSQ